MAHAEPPSVCIVGRPNVGKSTLFNRIIGRRRAVVHETSGTTRDRIEEVCDKGGSPFRLVDTGGYLEGSSDRISALVKRQIEQAVKEADILLFVCDVSDGVTAQDGQIVPILRRCGKRIFLVVNKADNRALEDGIFDFYKLGLGNPYPVSALHNRGISKLTEDLQEAVGSAAGGAAKERPISIAITGRPNVGKSLFLNNLLNKDRVIVDDKPGTTRDSVDTYFEKDGRLYLLIDTAGIRHRRKVKEPIDVYSMSRSREAIERGDVSFLLIDGYEGLRNDDLRVFDLIVKAGKCCVIVVNKWDLVKGIEMAAYSGAIARRAPATTDYPVVFASARTGRNIISCVDMVKYVMANSRLKIATNELNKFLSELKRGSRAKLGGGPKLNYIVQTSVGPPSFVIFVNDLKQVTKDYAAFVEGALRRRYNFYGTPVRVNFRRKR